jgi:hypothetical protein
MPQDKVLGISLKLKARGFNKRPIKNKQREDVFTSGSPFQPKLIEASCQAGRGTVHYAIFGCDHTEVVGSTSPSLMIDVRTEKKVS